MADPVFATISALGGIVSTMSALSNQLSEACTAMRFNQAQGRRLGHRVKFVEAELKAKTWALREELRRGTKKNEDARRYIAHVQGLQAVMQDAVQLVKKCQGSWMNRLSHACSLRRDIDQAHNEITRYESDLQLSQYHYHPPQPVNGGDQGHSCEEIEKYGVGQLRATGLFTEQEIGSLFDSVRGQLANAHSDSLDDNIPGFNFLSSHVIHAPNPDLVFEPVTPPTQLLQQAPIPRSPVRAIAARLDTGLVFSGHHTGEIYSWCVRTGACKQWLSASPFQITALLVTATGSLLVGDTNGFVRLLATEAPYFETTVFSLRGAVTAIAASDQGMLIGGDNFGGLAFQGPVPVGTTYNSRAHSGSVTALCVAENYAHEALVYSGGVDGLIKVWRNGLPLTHLDTGPVPRGQVLSIFPTPFQSLFVAFANGHVARWVLPGGEQKCALELTTLNTRTAAPVAFSERGLLFSTVRDGRHVAFWHIGDLTSESVRFLKQVGPDDLKPVACDGLGTLLSDGVYGFQSSRITCLKVVEVGWPGRCAVLVTGHEDGRVGMWSVDRWT